MCRMFGFRSAVPSRAHRSLVEAENALSTQSTLHPDGWGIGWFVDDDAYVVKASSAAHACERFQRASVRLTSHTFLVHVRKATVGLVDPANAHPFRFGRWLFAHNGTLFGFEQLRAWLEPKILPQLRPLVLGDTDSEHLFYYLLSELERAGIDRTGRRPSDALLVGEVVRGALLAIDERARELDLERPIANILLTDGRLMVGHRAGMPLLLSTQKRFCADLHTCPAPSKVCMQLRRTPNLPVNHFLLASERIGEDENIWEDLPDGATVVLDERFMVHHTQPPAGWIAPELPERYRIRPLEEAIIVDVRTAS